MDRDVWQKIAICRSLRGPKAEWRRVLGADFGKVERLLTEAEAAGELWFPCPQTGIRLRVRQRRDGHFYAYAPPEAEVEAPRVEGLTANDVQPWAIDWGLVGAEVAAALGLRPAAEEEADAGGGLRLTGTAGTGDAARRVFLVAADGDADILRACERAARMDVPATVLVPRSHDTAAGMLLRGGHRACVLGDVVAFAKKGRAWVLAAVNAEAVTAPGVGARPAGAEGVKITQDYKVIRIPGKPPIALGSRPKARAVVRFIHEQLKAAGRDDFYVEEMRERFNARFKGHLAGKQWKSDRFREDLFRDGEADFDLLFEILDKADGHYRMKV